MVITAVKKIKGALLLEKLTLSLLLSFCLSNFFKSQCSIISAAAQVVTVKVGVVLDKESLQGKMEWRCMNMAISDFYTAHPLFQTRISLHDRHSAEQDALMSAAAAYDLVRNEQVAVILGPETSVGTQFVTNLGQKTQVPIVSYSSSAAATASSLQNPYVIKVTQNESSPVQPLSALIQAFEWREVVPIYTDNGFGGGLFEPFLDDALRQIGTRMPYRSVIPSSASDVQIEAELEKLRSMQTRVFIVHMTASVGSRLFLKANQMDMMTEGYVWIITNVMTNVLESVDRRVTQSIQGVLGLKTYVPKTRELQNFTNRWQMTFQQENPNLVLNVNGFWAYDAITALARAVEQVGVANFTFNASAGNSANTSTDITDNIGVSEVGPRLLQAILGSNFRGLSGNFSLVDGQLQSPTFELINVMGTIERGIGYWTPSGGLVKEVTTSSVNKSIYSVSKDNLRAIVWPGDNTIAPKGWLIPPNGTKLKIGVPIKFGFREFVNVTRDNVTGFCIDVFDAAMRNLGIQYEYIPYTEHPGKPTHNYTHLIEQVFLKVFDAAVGDITIRAARTNYVDFTMPYSKPDVVKILPLQTDRGMKAWLFTRPWSLELWVTTLCSFVFMAFVIWVLEHRINENFRGPPQHQAGTSLFYSFSTLVFSHSFSVYNNLTRFVVVVWVFVVFILLQSYTANLASLLTVQFLQPPTATPNRVGYQEGSFVKDILTQSGQWLPHNLVPYSSAQELNELLTKGANNGGIGAAYDEVPFASVFLDTYCSNYTMHHPVSFRSDGFGFAFPIDSPLVSQVSREVLRITEGKQMDGFEKHWLNTNNCDQDQNPLPPPLGLENFWTLFTIVGGVSLVALIIHSIAFLRKHKDALADDPNASLWTRTTTLMKIYDQRDESSHTFRKTQPNWDLRPIIASLPGTPDAQFPLSLETHCESQSSLQPENADDTSNSCSLEIEGQSSPTPVNTTHTIMCSPEIEGPAR